jgi:pimeloyl-ACP methyl ester carboxylesterase
LAAVTVVVFCHGHALGIDFDPNPVETDTRGVELQTSSPPDGPFAAVGWRQAGLAAAALAASEASRVGRLVLCCVPAPIGTPLDFDPADITAKTLVLYGQLDANAPPAHARWWKAHIPDVRVEMLPRQASDLTEAVWRRVMSHSAPRRSS